VGYYAPAQDGASRVLLGVWTGAITEKRTGPYQTRVGCEREWEIFPSPKWVEGEFSEVRIASVQHLWPVPV
jgi:hypothetical protein